MTSTMTDSTVPRTTDAVGGDCGAGAPVDGLMAYYPFSGNADNVVGAGYDGVIVGGTSLTEDRNGNPDSAYAFDGDGDYIDLGDFDVPSWDAYSVSVWFLHDGGGASGRGYGQKVMDKTTWYSDFHISVQTQPGAEGGLLYKTYQGGRGDIYDDSADYRDGMWHHAVVTKDGSNGELWVDGALMGTSTETKTVFNDQPLLIGYSVSGDHYQQRFFSGKIDDIRIYDRVLTEDEIQQLFTLSDGPSPSILGTADDDLLKGTPAADVIAGLGGDDEIAALAGNDLLFGDSAAKVTFVSESAGYRNTIGMYDPVTGAATIVLPDASNEVADGFEKWLCAPCDAEWFLVPNGAALNGEVEAGGGYEVVEVAGRWHVLDADGAPLNGTFQGRSVPGAYFSQAERNPDNQAEHVKALADGTMGWEDLWNGGDRDFNDVILDVATYGEGPAGNDLLIGGPGDDILCGGAGSDILCGDGQRFAFVSEGANYASILAYADTETGAARVVLTNTDHKVAEGFAADLCVPEDALWCLIPNGHNLNSGIETGGGYRLTQDSKSGYYIETADGTPLLATIKGQTTAGAFFSDAAYNADGEQHVRMQADGVMVWEDLWIDGADGDFNDLVVKLAEHESGADTFVITPMGGSCGGFPDAGAPIGMDGLQDTDIITDFEPGTDQIDLTAFGLEDEDALEDLLAPDDGSTILDLAVLDGPLVDIVGVDISDLSPDDFLL